LANPDASAGAEELVAAVRAGADLARASVYVAGPDAFARAAEFALVGAGVPAGSITLHAW
jgi:hypothetical protein